MVIQQNLSQDAKTQEENYLLYEHKREEARISNALDQGGILNVALAEQPVVPALPKRSPLSIALLTLLLAGTFSLATAFVTRFHGSNVPHAGRVGRLLRNARARRTSKGWRLKQCSCDTSDFDEDPFGTTPDPRWLYRSPTHREALASLMYGYYSNRGFTAIIAPPGLGKTTLLFRFLEDIRTSARTVFLI